MKHDTETTIALAREVAAGWFWETPVEQPEPNRLDIRLASADELVNVVTMLRVKRLGYLTAITGLDLGPENNALEALYHFCVGAAVITLRVALPRNGAAVPTLSEIIPGAAAFEQELSEMFGVTVRGLRAPVHLYLPDDWPADEYPLRKEFAAEQEDRHELEGVS